jgi:hypothetical protein
VLPKEDCDKKATEILKTIIPEFNNRTLTKFFHLGSFKDGQVRPIVCCFHHIKDKLAIVSNRSKFQQQKIILSEDDDARALLRPSFTAAKRMNFDTKLQGNRIIVSGKSYSASNLHKPPKPLRKENIFTPQQHNITAFFTQNSPLSNHYLSAFTCNEIQFNCMEQYLMASKSSIFKDHETYLRIIQESDPTKQKHLGKNIMNYNHKKWLEIMDDIVIQGLKEKFTQSDF